MHRRAVHNANARQFWLWRVPSTPHYDRFGTDIGNRTYSWKPMPMHSHAWKLVAVELQDSSDRAILYPKGYKWSLSTMFLKR